MNILLIGACGRMGRAVAETAPAQGHTIVCGVDFTPSPPPMSYPIYANLSDTTEKADVVIDFSSPRGLEERLGICEAHGLPVVLGVTGCSQADDAVICRYGTRMTIFRSENLSLGVNLLRMLVKRAAKILGDGFDAEIVERHHGQKADAPSGTALMLARSVAEGFGGEKYFVCGREGITGARKRNEIGIHSVRGGTIVGDHEVMFAGEDEILTLSHSAQSRKIFALGALRAAEWLLGKPHGVYNMDDLLSEIL